MKHLKSILVLVVLLALLGASQPAFVHADELPAATDAGQVNVADVDASVILPQIRIYHDFDINIPRTGYTDTPETYTVEAGKYVVGYLQNSGGHNVYMTVIRASDQYAFGSKIEFTSEGQTLLLWTNTTSTTQYVKVRMSSSYVGLVHATGTIQIGWY